MLGQIIDIEIEVLKYSSQFPWSIFSWNRIVTSVIETSLLFGINVTCLSSLHSAHVIMFMQISTDTKCSRRLASKHVRDALQQSAGDVPATVQFVMELPLLTDHQKHYMGVVSKIFLK